MKSILQCKVKDILIEMFGPQNVKCEVYTKHEGAKLYFDFFILPLNVYVEIDGKQHETFVPFFHNDRKDFARQVHRDNSKELYVEDKNASLLRIPSDFKSDNLQKDIHELILSSIKGTKNE